MSAYKPETLLGLQKQEEALALMFKGLQQHYIECLVGGRIDVWAKAAHSMIDFMADDPPGLVRAKRREIST